MKPVLKLDWCSHEAAKYAVEKWHYSGNLPSFGRKVKIGVWENEVFVGAIIFAYSATPNVAKSWSLQQTEIVELSRVALSNHSTEVTRILKIALRMFRQLCPGIRLIVSFADADRGHRGGIYQAGNWIYCGLSMAGEKNGYLVHGEFLHCRTAGTKGRNTLAWVRGNLDSNATEHLTAGKHRYLMPLDAEMRARIAPLAKPYPKRAVSVVSDATANHAGEGGATPTTALSEQTS